MNTSKENTTVSMQPNPTKKFFVGIVFFVSTFLSVLSLSAQNYLINPTTDGGFEGNHGWTILNHPTAENKWFIGGAVKNSGSNGAYVSNSVSTQAITSPQSASALIFLYKDVVVPANASSITLSFSFRNASVTTNPPRVFFAKTSDFTAPATNAIYSNVSTLNRVLSNTPAWTAYTNPNPLAQDRQVTFTSRNLEPGESYRILFEWSAINQTSYTQTFPTPPTRYPVGGVITPVGTNYTAGTNKTYTLVFTQDGVNYGIEWFTDGAARLVSGQGTRTATFFFPLGTTGTQTIRARYTAPTPSFQFNGVNSGSLAIDDVSLAYTGIPSINSISAVRGEVGSNVTLSGEFFDPTASNNTVYLGGAKCAVVSGNANSLVVTIPAHAHAGTFTVTNTVTKLTATSTQRFLPVHPTLSARDYAAAEFSNNSFEAPIAFSTSFSSSFDRKFALVDVEEDGKLDVISYASSGVPQFLRNTATSGKVDASTFASLRSITGVSPTYSSPSTNSSRSILYGDFNGDGKQDFGASNNVNNGGFVNPNSSNATAGLGASATLLTSGGSYKVNGAFLSLDINRDGKLDVFGVSSEQGQVRPFYSRNTSTGSTPTFVTRESTTRFDLTSAYGGDVADFDGNGTMDAVYGADGFVVLLNNTTRRGTPFEDNFTLTRSTLIPISVLSGKPYAVKFFDLDGDGLLDIVASNSESNVVHVWRKTGTGFTLAPRVDIQVLGLRNTVGLSIADMNGDGKPDLVVGDYPQNTGSKIAYLQNQSTSGTVSFKQSVILIESASAYQQLEVVDIDGDRKPDILGANVSNSTLDVFRNRLGESGRISGETTICAGDATVLISSGAAGSVLTGMIMYSWQRSTTSATSGFTTINGETGATLSPGALNQTTFFRRGIASSSTPGTVYYSLPVRITVNALPTITNAPAVSNCGPGQVVLKAETSAGDGSFVSWYDAATGGTLLGRTASGANFTSPTVTQSTTFYAEAETASGCISAARVAVPVTLNLALPVVTLGNFVSTQCDAGDFTLTASTSSEAVIRWYDAATGGTLLREGNSFTTPILSASTTYYVEAVNCNGSSARQAVQVTLVPLPTITSAPNVSICQNGSTTLTATASAGTLNWYTAATGGTANAANATVSNINTATVIRYVSASVTVNGVTCEGPRVPVTVTMNNLPTLTATNASIFGESAATISVSNVAGTSVSWYADAAASQLLLAGNHQFTTPVLRATTIYYAVATDLTTGCQSAIRPVTVTYSGPTFSSLANSFASTNQQNMQIKASGLGNYLSYKWQRSDNGGATWADVTASLDGITYSGFSGNSGATATLTLSVADPKLHGYQYRILLTGTSSNHSVPTGTSILTVADIYGTGTTGTQAINTLTSSTAKTGLTNLAGDTFTSSSAHLSDGNLATGMLVTNSETYTVAGRALAINSSAGTINVPSNSNLNFTGNTTNFAIEAWVKISSGATANINSIVGKKTAGGGTAGYAFYINTYGTNDRKLILETTSGGAVSSTRVPSDTWTHVAVSVSNGTATLYINGVADVNTGSVGINDNSSISMQVGAFGDGNFKFSGALSDVRVWNASRSSSQISSNRSLFTTAQTGLVLNYQLTSQSGNTAIDNFNASLNGTISGTAQWTTDGPPVGSGYAAQIVANFGSSVTIKGIRLANLSGIKNGGTLVTPNPTFEGGYIESSVDGTTWTKQIATIPTLAAAGATLAVNDVTASHFRVRKEDPTSGKFYGLAELAFLTTGYETVPYIRQALPSQDIYVFQGTTLNLSTTATASAGQTITGYQWSSSTSETGPFTNLSDGTNGFGTVTGAMTNSLSISNYSNSTPTFFRLTATQSNGGTVSSQTQNTVFIATDKYYPRVNLGGSLQSRDSWTGNISGIGGSRPEDFALNRVFILANGSTYGLTGGDWTNNGTLVANNSHLTLDAFTATLSKWDGFGSTAFVKNQGAGYLSSTVSSTPKTFPIGNTRYSPVTLTRNSGTDEAFFVRVMETVTIPGATNYLGKTWVIKKTNAASSGAVNVDATFAWDPADLVGGNLSTPMVFQASSNGTWTELVPNTDYASLEIGSNQLTVRGLKGLLSTADRFFIIKNAVPKVTSISPSTTGTGQTITITGTGFTGATAVTLGGTTVTSFTVVSPTQITAVVGAGTTGAVVVTTPGGTATLNAAFTFLAAPTISSFSPVREQVGNRVTITGTNFTSVTGVTIGGVAVTSYQVTSTTSINAFVPAGASPGSVTVTTLGGTASLTGFSVGFSTPQNPELANVGNMEVRLSDRELNFATPFSRSNGAITISTPANNGVANYAANKISFQAIGTTTLTISQASTLDYQALTRTPTITVRDFPILEFADLIGTVGDPTRTLAATSNNSQGAFTYQSSNAAVGSISGSTLTIQGKGIAEITATQAAAGFYLGASAKAVLLVKDPTKPDPTLTWISPLSKTLDDVTVTVAQATSNSTGAITYYSSNPQVATISNRTVTLVGNGVTVLTAAQEESNVHNAGKAVTILIVGDPYKLPAQLTGLANVTKLVTDAAFTITAPSTQSAATIQYVLGDDRIASISGNTVTLKTNGTTKIYALQKETATHQAAMTEATLQVNLPPVPVIDYSDALNLRVGTNITPLTPTSTAGTVTQYSVWPPLPAGLTLNAQSGVIQGTPTVLAEPTTYQVTGANLGGPAQTPVQLSVIDLAPTNLSYTSPRVLIKDQVSTAAFPTLGGGGAVVSYTITPALPVGLTFNTGTGEISGTPLVISTASNYTIKAINSGGEASFTLNLTVNDIAPASLSYPSPNQLSRNVAMAPLSPIATGGQISQFAVIGTALPAGLTLNAQTGVISGAPTGVFDLATFTIRGQNASGSVDATLEIVSNDSPPVIAYTSPTRVTKGQAMTALVPSSTGGAANSFTISPALPTGLSFDETTGAISGTPTVLSPSTVYSIRAYNFSGDNDFSLDLAVVDVPPSTLSYLGTTTFTKGTAIASLSPTASGGPVTQYSIAPSLPQGLVLDQATGVISGTPTALMAATSFTITATNSGGSTTFSLSFTVNDVAPSALTYPSRDAFVRGTAIQAMAATASGGTVISYSIAPALPTGLVLNTSTGEITGTPTAVAAAANYVVTASNSGGSTTATLSLQVRKSTLLVTVDAATKIFGQADPTFAVTYSGFVLGEGVAQVSGQAAYARTAGENVGNYAVTASGLSSNLYEFNYQAGILSITRKSVATGISIDAIANQTYTGAALTPALVVKDLNSTLTLGTDYTLAYTSNTNVGTATATITGIGNYSGTKTQTFAIVSKAASTLIIDAIANQTYTGLALTPGVVLKDGSTTLTLTTDYTVAYTNNTNVGTATVTITGAGNYSGTKTQTFAIVGKGASTLTIDAIANQTYTGAALTPGVVVRDGNTALTLTTDYTVAYTNNTNVGTATVTITGAGNYSGTKTQTFAIVTKAASMLTIDAIANQTYTGSALTPALVVKDGNTTLTLTTDYTVAYTSNTNVGTATVTITGAGNYSGTKTQTFTIVAKAASTLTIDAIANQNFTGAALTPAVLVKDGSATLTLGTDYSVAYTNNVNVGTATVTITGLGNYSGTKTQTFEILTKMASLLTIEAVANQTYTGAALSPAVVVKDGSTTLTLGTDYSVAYSNNTNAGTASLTITGLGAYSGTKTASFVIGKAPLTVRVVNASKNYGQADPGFGVTYSGFLANQTASLLSGTLSFSRAAGQNPGIYAVTASGLSSANYSFTYVSGTLTIVAVDTDGDGVPDHVEDQDGTDSNDPRDSKDSDGDGVPDYVEIEDGTDPSDPKDYKDSDGDGLPDYVEAQDGTDPSDPRDYKDSDGDGVPDYVEIQDGTDPNDPRDYKDSDGDGVPDYVEIQDGTDPSDPKDYKDSDGDGVPDYVEVQNGTDPSDPKDYKDSDGDGVPDYVEIQDGTDPDNPIGAKDSDGDGVPDFVEKQQGTDPANPRSFLDSDGGGVPDHVETVVYPRLGLSKSNPTNSIDDFSDRDGDGVSDYQEYLEGTDPRDPSDYKDSDGDGVPDQVEIKEGSNPNSASSFKDSDGDGVADYIQIRSFREGTPTDLVVLWGDSNFASKLSNRVLMRTSRNELVSVQVTWDDLSGVKPLARGTYLAKGTVVVPKGYFNPYKIKGLERVIVLPKAAPLDVTLTNSSFVGSTSTYFISVGDFAVTDPVDKVHVVSLNGPGYDNKYFEIKNNILFWSSADLAAGKTKFSIIVRVTDRDGNTLDKFFEISRSRPSVSDITIYNSFSPNGDGINDTWGIEAARFYSGTKLQIFDRGGVRIFNSEDPTQRWDGTYQGKELPIGTYYWILEVGETGEMRRGVLNVLKK